MRDGVLTTVDSVVIRYGLLCFACFQVAGVLGNRNAQLSTEQVPSIADYIYAQRPQEKAARSKPPPLPFIPSAQHNGPLPSPALASANANKTWLYDNQIQDVLSPTVANGAAILGSLINTQPYHPSYQQHSSATSPGLYSPYDQFAPSFASRSSHSGDSPTVPDYQYAANSQSFQTPGVLPFAAPGGHFQPLTYPPYSPVYPSGGAYQQDFAYHVPLPHHLPPAPDIVAPSLHDSQTLENQLHSGTATEHVSVVADPPVKAKRVRKSDGIARTCSACGEYR